MTNKEILEIALQQSAYDCNCKPKDYILEQNIVKLSNIKCKRTVKYYSAFRGCFLSL